MGGGGALPEVWEFLGILRIIAWGAGPTFLDVFGLLGVLEV